MIGVEFKEDILFRIELYDPSAILIRYPFFFGEIYDACQEWVKMIQMFHST